MTRNTRQPADLRQICRSLPGVSRQPSAPQATKPSAKLIARAASAISIASHIQL